MYQSELASRFSTHIHFDRAETIEGAVAQSKIIKPDIALICPTWRFGCGDIKHLLDALRAAGAIRKIVFIDTCDATSTPFLPLLRRHQFVSKAASFSRHELVSSRIQLAVMFLPIILSISWDGQSTSGVSEAEPKKNNWEKFGSAGVTAYHVEFVPLRPFQPSVRYPGRSAVRS